MSYQTAEGIGKKEKKKFEQKQERITKGKAKKENKTDWRLGAFCKECR